jgi:hypothetical protein
MIKIESQSFNHVVEVYEFKLENGDTVWASQIEIEREVSQYSSRNMKKYAPVFKETEYNDEPLEIIGFEEIA